MLLISTEIGSCLLVRDSEIGRIEIAAARAGLDWAFDSVELVAEVVKPIRLGGVERVPCALLDFIDPERAQALGYLAYKLTDELSKTAQGRARECVAACYHQISDTLRRILLLHQVVTTASQRAFIVDDELVQLVSSCARSVKSLQVIKIDEPARHSRRSFRRVFGLPPRTIATPRYSRRSWRRVFGLPPRTIAAAVVKRGLRAATVHFHLIKNTFARLFSASIDERRVMPPIRLGPATPTHTGGSEILVMTLDDSGKRSNLDPAEAVLRELNSRGMETVVLTESPFVASAIGKAGLAPVLLASDYVCTRPMPAGSLALRTRLCAQSELDLRLLLNAMLRLRNRYLFHRLFLLENLIAEVGRLRAVRVVVSINETWPPSVVAGRWANRAGKPWIGHSPILVGRRPDGYYFPADFHLVYGDQLRDHMLEAGVRSEAIEVVGSYIYDKNRGRDRVADRQGARKVFPRIGDKKLVTVLTEVLPSAEKELAPVLTAVSALPDVHLILKVHPDDSVEQFDVLARNLGVRDQIDVVKLCDLSELLGASDLLICVMSNVAIEAAVAGTPTLLCDFLGRTTVINLVEEGLCVGCSDPSEVGEVVKGLLFDPVKRKQALDLMATGIRRFNGPNDGHSAKRIVDFVLASMGFPNDAGCGHCAERPSAADMTRQAAVAPPRLF